VLSWLDVAPRNPYEHVAREAAAEPTPGGGDLLVVMNRPARSELVCGDMHVLERAMTLREGPKSR
jgi:hypothetical protein